MPCVPACLLLWMIVQNSSSRDRETRVPHLGFGTCSSGTGVHTDSLFRCSLNLPLKAFSMSSM